MGSGSSRPWLTVPVAEARLGARAARVRAAFDAVAKDGHMDQSQFCGAVLRAPVPSAIARAVFALCDVRVVGFLTWAEFVAGMALLIAGTVEEKCAWLERLFDVDGDGEVSIADFKYAGPDGLKEGMVVHLHSRHTSRAMLAVDLLARALPAQQVQVVIDAMANEVVPTREGPLTRAALLAWARAHQEQSSLSAWAFATQPMPVVGVEETPTGDGEAPAANLEVSATCVVVSQQTPMTPLDLAARSLSDAIGQAVALDAFLAHWDYADAGKLTPAVDVRAVAEALLADERPESRRLAWAFCGVRPPTAADEHTTVAWLQEHAQLESHARVRFLLASEWFQRWRAAGAPGPLDNAALIRPGTLTALRAGLEEGRDYAVLLPVVWLAMRAWHGGGPAIQRPFVADLNMVEVYPMQCRVYVRLSARPKATLPHLCDESHEWTASRLDTVGILKTTICSRLNFRAFFSRLWLIDASGTFVALDKDTQSVVQAGVTDGADVCVEVAFLDGTWPLDSDARVHCVGASDDGRTAAAARAAGSLRVGLRNMGNTCYFNAALQCLLAAPALSLYFSRGLDRKELNARNPIGYGGRVAGAYGNLVRDIVTGTADVVTPLQLRAEVGIAHPEFAGMRQHDSQELLSWLLDALHEDLNRVIDKPAVQDPDDTNRERSDADLAAEFWANHVARNNSVVVDLFHGQIKSRLVCNDCKNVSRKFEAFSSLSVPLPLEDMRLVEVLVYPTTAPAVPTRYGVRLPKNAKMMELKVRLYELTGHKPRTLALFSVWSSRHDRLFTHADTLDAVRDNDTVHAYVIHSENAKLSLCNPPPRPVLKVAVSKDDDQDDLALPSCLGQLKKKRRGKQLVVGTQHPVTAPPSAEGAAPDSMEPLDAAGNEEEEEARLEKQLGGVGSALDVCYVQVVHRRVEQADGTPLFNGSVPRTFGAPLLLSTRVVDYNTATLYEAVWVRVQHLISHEYDVHKEPDAPAYPFRLSVVDHSGLSCGVCLWNRFCVGCPLSDRHIDPQRHLVLAIDWSLDVLRRYYSADAAQHAHVHASVQQNRDLQDYPVGLDECLRLFSSEEQLEDWYCGQCKELRTATKSLTVFRVPRVLVLHLKRFQLHRNLWAKTNKLVHFPLGGLTIAPEQPNPLSLFGVISHFGGMGGGHYTASARLPGEEEFHYFDDSRYRALEDPNMVVTRAAYVLFYGTDGTDVNDILARVNVDAPDLQPRNAGGACSIL